MPDEAEKEPAELPRGVERADREELPASVPIPPEELLTLVMQFSGPLPPPQILKAYDAIIPGAAKEMHELALAKARHDMEMERDAMGAQTRDEHAARAQFKRGQYLAFVLALVLIGCGTTCILTGHDAAGAGIIVSTLVALVLAFIWGRKAGGPPEEPPEDNAQSDPSQS